MTTEIKKYLPQNVKKGIKYLIYSIEDGFSFIFNTREEFIPPKRKIFIGDGDFKKTGDEFFRYFVEIAGLTPEKKVLDIGSGIGRMAIPLTKYLNTDTVYEGIDIVPMGVNWCKEKITPRYPNFNFQLADVYNKSYNPTGKYKASEYKFPFKNNSFEFIFLISVFTHMLPPDVKNYVKEISRVLSKGNTCLITFFLLNTESLQLVKDKKSILNFEHQMDGYLTVNKKEPELAVAYEESFIKKLLQDNKLEIKTIKRGSWCGRENYLSYQDIVIAEKI